MGLNLLQNVLPSEGVKTLLLTLLGTAAGVEH